MNKTYAISLLATIHLASISMEPSRRFISRVTRFVTDDLQEARQLIATNADVTDWAKMETLLRNESDLTLIEQFFKRGVNPNRLTVTANILSIEKTDLLLRYGANPNYLGAHDNQTPLHILAATFNGAPGDIEKKIMLAKLLFKHRAQLHVKNANNRTPLDQALSSYTYDKDPKFGFQALAELLNSEARYRLMVEIESSRRKNVNSSGLAQLPKDVIKIIIFKIHPSLDPILNKTP